VIGQDLPRRGRRGVDVFLPRPAAAGIHLIALAVADAPLAADLVIQVRTGGDGLRLQRREVRAAVLAGDHVGQVVRLDVDVSGAVDRGHTDRREWLGGRLQRRCIAGVVGAAAAGQRDEGEGEGAPRPLTAHTKPPAPPA
jgi:hypothetical protein